MRCNSNRMFCRDCSRRKIGGLGKALINVIAISDWTARPCATKSVRKRHDTFYFYDFAWFRRDRVGCRMSKRIRIMRHYPIFMDLKELLALVVGSCEVAERK